eukprot:985117_1
MASDENTIKVVVLGAERQGKSALILKFITGQFEEGYDATIEEIYQKLIEVEEETVVLEIVDTAGVEDYAALVEQSMVDGQIFVLTYSVASSRDNDEDGITAFLQCSALRDKVLKLKSDDEENPPFILVGTKCDVSAEERTFSTQDGEELAGEFQCPYIEVSAKHNLNVNELWDTVVTQYTKYATRYNHDRTRSFTLSLKHVPSDLDVEPTCCSCINNCLKPIQVASPREHILTPIGGAKYTPMPVTANKKHTRVNTESEMMPMGDIAATIAIEEDVVCYYPKRYKYSDVHHGILLDFVGIVIGRKPDQDPEIERDRKWFLRQTMAQKVKRVVLSLWMWFIYVVCFYNVSLMDGALRVSLMETLGPALLLSVLWILLSLWIAYESRLKPQRPPLSKLRSIYLYFGHDYDETTSAYKFLRGYVSSIDDEDQLRIRWSHLLVMLVLAAFYGCIPGLTRFFIGDSSDGLHTTGKFITRREAAVEVGALIANVFLLIAVMYTVSVQHKKYMDNYREWMYELTMFLVTNKVHDEVEDMDQLEDDFDDLFGGSFADEVEDSFSLTRRSNKTKSIYLPQKMYLSLKMKANVFGFLEIRSFLESQGKLFFGEQELPMIWMMVITIALLIFLLYRAFFMEGYPFQSVLFNGVYVLVAICLMFLIQIMIIAHQFDELQIRQEAFIHMQEWNIQCAQHTVSFVRDMLSLVKRNDIYPKIYGLKVKSVLLPLILVLVISVVVIIVKVFLGALLF